MKKVIIGILVVIVVCIGFYLGYRQATKPLPDITIIRQKELDSAEKLFFKKQYPQAMQTYQQIYQKYPDWNDAEHAMMMVGACYDAMGQYDNAIQAYQRTIQKYPELKGWSEATYSNLGDLYYRTGQKEKALEAFKKSLQLAEGVRDPNGNLIKFDRKMIDKLEKENKKENP